MSPPREYFEIVTQDTAGRLGRLRVPRSNATIETPALLPVVHPDLQTVDPARLESDFGAEILITNAYIIRRREALREAALAEGLHHLLDFSGPIMTDSGSFQLAEYGTVDVTNEEILRFQRDIGSDIATPLDIPTPPDAARETAESDLETTEQRLLTAESFADNEMLVSAPIQGSTHLDLRTRAASFAYERSLDLFPVGAVVPLLTEYRYADVVDIVMAARRGLGADAPIHLFGAGHPMMFALAVAAGCDLFDSAAYVLYAREGRYLTVDGTYHLDDLEEFPCACPVCLEHDPKSVREHAERDRLLSEHNLYVTFEELRTVKRALRDGSLLELLESRCRSHPALLAGYRQLLGYPEELERTDPVRKRTFFYCSAESAHRPEVHRYQRRLVRLDPPGRLGLRMGSIPDPPPVLTPETAVAEWWPIIPPFGPVPPELTETYPLNAERPPDPDQAARSKAIEGIRRLADAHPQVSIVLEADEWPATELDERPDSLEIIPIANESTTNSASTDDGES